VGRTTRRLAGAVGLLLGASLLAPTTAYGAPTREDKPQGQTTSQPTSQPTSTATVTLITGDVVSLSTFPDGRQTAAIKAGPSAGHQQFQTVQHDGHAYVYPDSVVPYLASGLLDERLFDVTQLVADGYDDAHTASLPLILQYTDGTKALLAQPAPAASHKTRDLPSIGGVAVTVPRGKSATFWQSVDDNRPVQPARVKPMLDRHLSKIWLDGKVKASLDASVPLIGAPAAWQAGLDGTGVTVAVLDTGIDTAHPDLADRVTESVNFSAAKDAIDHFGHGTHVASTIAGSGAASGGRYKGVAPGAKLLNGKVLDDNGSGPDSDVIAGMEWAASKARIVSMSLGSGPTDGTDPTSEAVNKLSAQYGTLFVIAAGNAGPGANTVASPGAADSALTVGASSKTDTMASFSSRGPRVGDGAVKPEITGPGVSIVAARAAGTAIGTPVGDRYTTLSGTSMATPHVAGSAAILAQEHPDWTGPQIKAQLTSTAKPIPGTVWDEGAGRVDVGRAFTQKVTASTGTLSLGRYTSHYGSIPVARKTVTYRNAGTTDVTLNLAVSASSDTGSVAKPAQLNVSPATLTVPAGGTADATVTLDPNTGDLGLYSGKLVAGSADGQTVLDAAVGYDRELLHTLTFTATARDGRPSTYATAFLLNLDTGAYQPVYLWTGQPVQVDVKEGQYAVLSFVSTMDAPNVAQIDLTAIAKPQLNVSADMDVALDARQAKPVVVHTPDPTAMFSAAHQLYRGTNGHSLIASSGAWDKLSVVPSEAPPTGQFEYVTRQDLEAPPLTARIVGPDVALHPIVLTSYNDRSNWLDGHRKLPAVYVGAGRPDDYAGRDVRGKVVVVRNTADVKIEDQVAAAAAARAAAVMVLGSAPGVFEPFVTKAALPTVGLSQAEGDDLVRRLGRGAVTLDLTGVRYSPYRYEPVLPYPQVPDGIDYTMDASNTGLQRTKVYAVRPNEMGSFTDDFFRPYMYVSFAVVNSRPFPFSQDRYYTAGDTRYSEGLYASFPYDGVANLFMTMKPGADTTKTYFKGPFHAGTSAVRPPAARQGDRLLFTFDSVVDAEPDHVNDQQGAQTAARIYRDGELVASGPYAVGYFDVGTAAPATYRVELDMPQGRPGWTVGTESYSAWTVRSARPATTDRVPLPVLNAHWDLDLAPDNSAPAGKVFALKLLAGTQAGAPPVAVKSAEAWVSYDDGGTWKALPMLGTDGSYSAVVRQPASTDTVGYAALKFEVTDANGAAMEQTLYHAYALK
jgi:subtilisin family serine protease